ncbi:MAG: hypothetical protein QGH39_09860 [Candidatus Thermoplasmatota archaeon]|nr:hypothetical protein [Candidatus Thermoplasmatota archaeon]MDP7265846.1 hypothetical protein [Candidatus Thermoplasmatota archaeon]
MGKHFLLCPEGSSLPKDARYTPGHQDTPASSGRRYPADAAERYGPQTLRMQQRQRCYGAKRLNMGDSSARILSEYTKCSISSDSIIMRNL